jgi:hypothetical protein
MKKTGFLISFLLVSFGIASACSGEQKLLAMRVAEPPVLDGLANDPAWENAQKTITLDKTNELSITIKAVYTEKEILFQVSFSDPDESNSFC